MNPLFSVYPPINWRILISPNWGNGFEKIAEFKAYRSDRGYLPQEVFNAMRWHRVFRSKWYCQIEFQEENSKWKTTYNWPIYRLKECERIILPLLK